MSWDELIKRLNQFPRIHSRLIEGSYKVKGTDEKIFIKTKPFIVHECETEEMAKEKMSKEILSAISDLESINVWVRVMPECNNVNGKWTAYARIAFEPKLVTA